MQNVLRLLGVVGIATVLALPNGSQACTHGQGNGGIFPENDMKIPLGRFNEFSIEKQMFMDAIDHATKLYAPVFEAQGRTLEIQPKWDDGTVNAYASRSGSKSIVAMFGGLARHPLVTADGFALVICHELGHHLGGSPKSSSWAANEGEADYFATLKCARETWKGDNNVAVVAAMTVDPAAKAACEKAWSTVQDVALCERAAMGGKSLADTLADLGKTPVTNFLTPDTSVVSRTNNEHPAAQCRLDTYFAGTLCTVSKDIKMDDKDPTVGACSLEKGDTLAFRPLCWYKPSSGGRTPTPGPTPSPGPGSSWPHLANQ